MALLLRKRIGMKRARLHSVKVLPHLPAEAASCPCPDPVRAEALKWRGEPTPVEVSEDSGEYKLSMSLCGVDPRTVYVFATPHSILVEVRVKSSVRHPTSGPAVAETIDRRISREFSFPSEIEQSSTTVELSSGFLRITARKCHGEARDSWSQLIAFDARGASTRH